jgi:hypothetical protein
MLTAIATSFFFLALLFLFFIFVQDGYSWRKSILASAPIWGGLLTALTEILSLFQSLNFVGLTTGWLLIDILLLLLYFKKGQSDSLKVQHLKQPIKLPKPSLSLTVVLCSLAIIILIIGLIAVVAPPNTWDSMTYHMSRVEHWIQNQSVSHYPTNSSRQLYLHPWAEFAILHLQILSNGDHLANLVQWFSMVGSVMGVSLIAKQLGANLEGQVLASVTCATIPMGILQASSTQNDYVLAFWLVCFVYYVLLIVQQNMSWMNILGAGMSLGLAVLTKGLGYIYALPFCIWVLPSLIQHFRGKFWKPIVAVVSIVILLNLGYYLRNFDLYRNPLTTDTDGIHIKNELFTWQALISNVLRNISLHLAIPVDAVTNSVVKTVYWIHDVIGISANDPLTTGYPKAGEFHQGLPSNHYVALQEDRAGNFIHFILICLCLIWHQFKNKLRKNRCIAAYGICIVVAFLLMCFLIKWMPWHSRYHLSLFVLFSGYIGVVLSVNVKKQLINIIATVLIIASFPWVFYNFSRPLNFNDNIFKTSRIENYFRNEPNFKDPYLKVADFIKEKKCYDIGLNLGGNSWEYPLWVLLRSNNEQSVRIKHIDVNHISSNQAKKLPNVNFIPCVIIAFETRLKTAESINIEEGVYTKVWSVKTINGNLVLFMK